MANENENGGDAQAEAGAVGGPALDQLTRILSRLVTNDEARERRDERMANAFSSNRIRAINCRSYKIGEDWANWVTHFRENIRAQLGCPNDDPRVDEACCTWLGSKLESGATLNAYLRLPTTVTGNWTRVNTQLATLFVNEEEKQTFLNQIGEFKKGSLSYLEYRNELTRRVDLYQPELKNLVPEYQRQLVNRFIGGIEDTDLQRKLRFHCKRDRMTLDAAYEYAVDYESTEVEERAKEAAGLMASRAAFASVVPGAGLKVVPNTASDTVSHTVPSAAPAPSPQI